MSKIDNITIISALYGKYKDIDIYEPISYLDDNGLLFLFDKKYSLLLTISKSDIIDSQLYPFTGDIFSKNER